MKLYFGSLYGIYWLSDYGQITQTLSRVFPPVGWEIHSFLIRPFSFLKLYNFMKHLSIISSYTKLNY